MFKLIVVWLTGEKEVYEYATRKEAENAAANMKRAFGSQVWVAIN